MTAGSHDPEEPYVPEYDDEDEMYSRRERGAPYDRGRQRSRVVSDFLRRAIEGTMDSVQNTGSLSKEALQYLFQQGDKGRREVLRIVANEVGDFLRHTDLSTELVKVLTGIQVELNASIRFKATEEGKIETELGEESGVSVSVDGQREGKRTEPEAPGSAVPPSDGNDPEKEI